VSVRGPQQLPQGADLVEELPGPVLVQDPLAVAVLDEDGALGGDGERGGDVGA
jgi:hypothetical protein